jgi:hypothetical protein
MVLPAGRSIGAETDYFRSLVRRRSPDPLDQFVYPTHRQRGCGAPFLQSTQSHAGYRVLD